MVPWKAEGEFRGFSLWQPLVARPGARNAARACGPRVDEGMCSWTPPSGCPMAFWQESLRQGVFGNPIVIFREDAGVSSLAGQRLCWLCCSLDQPPCQQAFFLERAEWGDRYPAHRNMWAFTFSYMIYFNYYLRGFGLLALTLPLFYTWLPYFYMVLTLFGDQITILKEIVTHVRLPVQLTAMSKHCDLTLFKLIKVPGKDFLQKKLKCKNNLIRDVKFGHYPQFEKHLPLTS